ncbi:Small nuclear ribonucleoprotein Sm D3 [Camelus dromedarius]|uniref:Small nuclear ribonucleoprotein Sm D3 n=1 Tax=Camelus dromedarius TaxID=9838 RepID=A0A5N4C563_CAMDR|nr:Small nuclear ribonucleoprotein Sm D3 [Camelus dromedarius]
MVTSSAASTLPSLFLQLFKCDLLKRLSFDSGSAGPPFARLTPSWSPEGDGSRTLPAKMSIGVPIKVLHEAEGKLIEAEDNMNCQTSNITVTYRDDRVAQLEQVYIRGSKIRFLILPDMLKNAPIVKEHEKQKPRLRGRWGKAAILKAQVAARGRGQHLLLLQAHCWLSPRNNCEDAQIVSFVFRHGPSHSALFR